MIGALVLTPQTMIFGWLLYVPLLVWAVWRASWIELFTDSRRQHVLFATVFALFLLWLVRRDFDTGVSYHFIGMTAVTLLLDWPLAIIGGLFVLEAVSVIVQVISFKLTGKRVFKMAPIHHHFEQLGWTESQIVIRFWIISIVLALAGLATLKLR